MTMATIETARIAGRVAEILPFYPDVPPQSWERALIDRVALGSLRIEECDRTEAQLLDRERSRARSRWLERQAAEIRHLVEELPRDPASVAPRLESTYLGARWKLASWDDLAVELHENGDWAPTSETLAWNLVGLRPPRNHPPIDPRTLRAHRSAVLERERGRLARLAEETLRARHDRESAEAERSAETSPLLAKVRKDRDRAWEELRAACRLLPRAAGTGRPVPRAEPRRGRIQGTGRANPIVPCAEWFD